LIILNCVSSLDTGQTGLGKSTMVNTLFASHLIESKGRLEVDGPMRQTTEIKEEQHGMSLAIPAFVVAGSTEKWKCPDVDIFDHRSHRRGRSQAQAEHRRYPRIWRSGQQRRLLGAYRSIRTSYSIHLSCRHVTS
jgi:energy-coupling factor transporter ATP-binding protein EcfA2